MSMFVFAMNSTSPGSFSLPSINIGNGLVEIGALTTLIGSVVTESLILGNQGAAGLAWASTSAFGSLSLVKACVSAACSGWLRETLGVRTKTSDVAVGMDLDLSGNSDRAHKVRVHIGEPLGIICDRGEAVVDPEEVDGARLEGRRTWRDVYAFDHPTSTLLNGVPDTSAGSALRVFTYARYPFYRRHNARFQLSTLVASLGKLAEFYTLWKYGGALLGFLTVIPWCYFFLAAIYIEIREILLARKPESPAGRLDIISGHLPAIHRSGGPRKIILSAAHNPRWSWWWRLLWATGALLCTTCLLLTYFQLGQQTKDVVLVWAGFQILWLVVRMLVYHIAASTDPMAHRSLEERPGATLSICMKERVLDLTLALAKYQIYLHPRGEPSYRKDLFSSSQLLSLLGSSTSSQTRYPLPVNQITNFSLQVDVKAVVGDTALSSVAWITGSKLTMMDLYDSCIVIFALPSTSKVNSAQEIIAIPAVRVLSGPTQHRMPSNSDIEKSSGDFAPQYVPKGSSNLGFGLTWWYWIPCESGLWLQIKNDVGAEIVGKQKGEVLSDTQVSNRLAAGTLNISLTRVSDVKKIVEVTQTVMESLLEFTGPPRQSSFGRSSDTLQSQYSTSSVSQWAGGPHGRNDDGGSHKDIQYNPNEYGWRGEIGSRHYSEELRPLSDGKDEGNRQPSYRQPEQATSSYSVAHSYTSTNESRPDDLGSRDTDNHGSSGYTTGSFKHKDSADGFPVYGSGGEERIASGNRAPVRSENRESSSETAKLDVRDSKV